MALAPSRRALIASAGLALSPLGGSGLARAGTAALGLHDHAARRGRFYGCAVSSSALASRPALMGHVRLETGMVVSENAFKWAALRPSAEKFDFSGADALMGFARTARLRVRGHNLAWHESNPEWLAGAIKTPGDAERVLRHHVATVAGRYRGRIAQWDVVNEPLRPEDGQRFSLRLDPWARALGPRYLDIAFGACAEADPRALRMLNEFGLEYAIPWQQKRRESLLALLADLLARNVPIQAVGLQSHLDAAETAFDPAVFAAFLARIAAMGLKIVVTELDVRDDRLPADVSSRDAAVAAHAAAFLKVALAQPAVLGVLSWGLSDTGSWLNEKFPRADKLPQRPLPLDAVLARKPLWRAIADGLDQPAR